VTKALRCGLWPPKRPSRPFFHSPTRLCRVALCLLQDTDLLLSPPLDPYFFAQLRYDDFGTLTHHVTTLVDAVRHQLERRNACKNMGPVQLPT